MENFLILQSTQCLMRCNALSERYGLTLSQEDALMVAQTKERALTEARRVEFGDEVLARLVEAFCDSPYLDQHCYADTLCELVADFYAFKNDCEGALSDEELIDAMVQAFNGPAQGSLDYMEGVSVGELCRSARNARYGGVE